MITCERLSIVLVDYIQTLAYPNLLIIPTDHPKTNLATWTHNMVGPDRGQFCPVFVGDLLLAALLLVVVINRTK